MPSVRITLKESSIYQINGTIAMLLGYIVNVIVLEENIFMHLVLTFNMYTIKLCWFPSLFFASHYRGGSHERTPLGREKVSITGERCQNMEIVWELRRMGF